MSRVQSIYFMDYEWSLEEAEAWMEAHRIGWIKVRKEGHEWRFKVREKNIFSRYRTLARLSGFGGVIRKVYLVIGFK